MTSKAQRNAGAPLPNPIAGYDTISFCGQIPDVKEYRSALWAVINAMCQWTHWEKSYQAGDTRARDAAAYMREILLSSFHIGDECVMHTHAIRQTNCTIELLIDGDVVSSFQLDAESCVLLGGSDGQGGGHYPLPATETATNEEKKTELFSGAMALVKFCSEAIADFFDLLETYIETGKTAVVWLETVPLLDLSPAYEVLEAADGLVELGQSLFEGTDTPTWREQMSCRIMCWCVENDYTFDRTVIDKWREWLAEQGLLAYPEAFYKQFVDTAEYRCLLNRFALGMNDGDEDWLILCNSCSTLFGEVTFDNPSDLPHIITYGSVAAVGNPDNGLEGESWFESPWTTGRRATIRIDLETDQHVKIVRFDWNYNTFPLGDCARHVRLYDAGDVLLDSWVVSDHPAKNEWHTQSVEFDETGVRYVVVELMFNGDYTGSQHIYLDNIRVYTPES